MSVCPSVTLVNHAQTVQDIEIYFTLYETGVFLVFTPNFEMPNLRVRPNEYVKQRRFLMTARIGPIIHHISETVQDMAYVTERRNGRYFALFHRIHHSRRSETEM